MSILWGGAAVYGLVVGGLYLVQDSLIFPRGAADISAYPLPATARTIELETADGQTIVGYHLPAREPSKGVLLGFGGNAWNAVDCAVFLAQRVPDYDVVAFHYRGYQPSSGAPSERAFYADAALIYDHLVEDLEPRRVVAAGFSLGSAVAGYLARIRPIDGLVLVTPFDSIEAIARQRYFWAPVNVLLKHRFRTDRHLAGLPVPTAVLIAGEDRIVPAAHSERLVKVLQSPILVETVASATHISIYDDEHLDDFLRRALILIAAGGQPASAPAPANESAVERAAILDPSSA
jgi:uncharacterized protein